MTKFVLRILTAIVCLLVHFHFIAPQSAVADDDATLTIGSQAPDIDIETWVSDRDGKFEHITKLQPKKIYVIEFWATWCGPCVASMPHLSEIQDKYIDDDVQIISISDEDMETVDSFLKRKVRGDDENTYRELTNNYCLTADSDRSVHDSYFRAAGQTGIPCAFIVGKTGLIEWIGHPMRLEKTLEKVVKDEWDRDEFSVEFKKAQAARALQRKMQIEMRNALKKIRGEDPTGGIEIIDEMLANEDYVDEKERLESLKTMALIVYVGGEEGIKELETFVDENSEAPVELGQMAFAIYSAQQRKGEVHETILANALKAAETAAEALPQHAMVQETHARLVHQSGDLDLATKIMEKFSQQAKKKSPRASKFLKQLQDEKLKIEEQAEKASKDEEDKDAKSDDAKSDDAKSDDAKSKPADDSAKKS